MSQAYETSLSAKSNIKLFIVRECDEGKVYCIARDGNGIRIPKHDNYYFKKYLTEVR